MAQLLQQTPPARLYHDSIVLKDTMFVWGGHTGNPGQHHSRLDMFSVNMLTGEWHQHTVTPPDTPPPCQQACSAAIGNTIYSYGGLSRWSPFTTHVELYKLNLEEMRWRTAEDRGMKPERRYDAGMCCVNRKLLLMGGYGPLPSQMAKHPQAEYKPGFIGKGCGWNNELFEFDPQTGCWSPICVTGSKPSPRSGHTLTAVDEKRAILFGGYDGEKDLNDVWLFDGERKVWSFITPSSPPWPQPRVSHTVCSMVCDYQEIKVLLMGGFSDTQVLSDCWLLDVLRGVGEEVMFDGETWSRWGHSAGCVTLLDGTVVVSVFGGCTSSRYASVVNARNPCFCRWDPRHPGVLLSGVAQTGAVLRLTEHIGEISSLREEHSVLLQQIEQSRRELSVQVQENDKQKKQLKAKESQIKQMEIHNTELTEQNERKTRLVEEVQIRIAETESQIRQLCRNEAELQQENEEQATLIQSLSEQTTELGETVTRQQSQLRDKQQAIDRLTAEKENEIEHISRENAELKQANTRLRQEIWQQSTQIQSLKEQTAGLHQTVSLQQTQLLQNQVAIDTLTEEKDKHIQDASRKYAELRQQAEEQSTQIQSLQALAAKMEEHIQQVCRENAQLRAEQVPCISGDTGIGDGSIEGTANDSFLTFDIRVKSSDGTVQPDISSVSNKIGPEGGKVQFQSLDVFLDVPPGAVPFGTTFSLETYVEPDCLPPVTHIDEVSLSPVFLLSSSLPQDHHFHIPLGLYLPVEVPLIASDHDNGWLLQLKRSESCDGLRNEWHTVLELNTDTGEVVSQSSIVNYDYLSCTLWLDHFCCFAWVGNPFRAIGRKLGFSSLRKIIYAVFGKPIRSHKWYIAAHIVHGSKVAYESLVCKLKEKDYVELVHPKNACIRSGGKVSVCIRCLEPWQVHLGKSESQINSNQIWRSGQHSSSYHEVAVEDSSCKADTLECTIEASFQAKGNGNAGDSVELVVSEPLQLTKPESEDNSSSTSEVPHSVTNDDNSEITEAQIDVIAKVAKNEWRRVGQSLGFKLADLDEYEEREPKSLHYRLFRLLNDWKNKVDCPTVGNILLACQKAGVRGVVKRALQAPEIK